MSDSVKLLELIFTNDEKMLISNQIVEELELYGIQSNATLVPQNGELKMGVMNVCNGFRIELTNKVNQERLAKCDITQLILHFNDGNAFAVYTPYIDGENFQKFKQQEGRVLLSAAIDD